MLSRGCHAPDEARHTAAQRLTRAPVTVLSPFFCALVVTLCLLRVLGADAAVPTYPHTQGPRCRDVPYGTVTRPAPPPADVVTSEPSRGVRSPNPHGATLVAVGLNLQEITDVDANAGSISVAGYLDQIWCDPSQRYETQPGAAMRRLIGVQATDRLATMWRPDLAFVNALEPMRVDDVELLIHPDGTIELRNTFFSRLAATFALRAFPFDVQVLRIEMESFSWELDELQFLNRTDIVGVSDELRIAEWEVAQVRQQVSTKIEARDRAEYSRVEASVAIRRLPGVYVTKVMLPLAVITLITMVVFWLGTEIFGSIGEMLALRLGTSFTGLLTAVAYQFIIAGNVPKHVYNTYLDAFVGVSFLAIALSIGQSAWVGSLAGREQLVRARRLDRSARWIFPACYLAGIGALYAIYTR